MKYFILVVLSIICADSHSSIYKCVNDAGAVSFQQMPCDDSSKTSEQLEIDSGIKGGPAVFNSKNEKLFKLAHYSRSIKFTALQCKQGNSSYTAEVKQAADRLYEIRKEEIEIGNKLSQRGFPNLSSSEISSLISEGKRKQIWKVSKMSRKELDRHCDTQARRARGIASMAKK
jgi:hypothetical protein